ncbi:hypothetical protein HK101_010721 [Irineochytrium annulatum]|nr:hypothetical protein HK101_010721 [Irineochytrium annulatum]
MQQFEVPAEFPALLRDLNREILRHQPKDVYHFCATYFHKKVAERTRPSGTQTGKGEADSDAVADGVTAKASGRVFEVQARNEESGEVEEDADMAANERADSEHGGDPETGLEPEPESEPEHEPSDLEDADDESEPEMPLPPPVQHNRGRRTSVSAESMAPSGANVQYERVDIPKTEEQRSRIDASIRGNFLFRACDEDQYADVVAAMSEKRVQPGEDVINQGGVGDYFYVVETGSLDVLVARNGDAPVKVTDYGAGGSFGELALMYNAPRAATVTAVSECVLWALDRVTFRRILMENTSRKRRMYEDFLEEVPLFLSLEPYERHKIADALESVVFNDGEAVIRQGDPGEAFFIIESGEADVSKIDDDGTEIPLPSLKKGDYFGGKSPRIT